VLLKNLPRTGSCTGRISGLGWFVVGAAGWPSFDISAILSSIVVPSSVVEASITPCVDFQLFPSWISSLTLSSRLEIHHMDFFCQSL
jgi:hypothetical protein